MRRVRGPLIVAAFSLLTWGCAVRYTYLPLPSEGLQVQDSRVLYQDGKTQWEVSFGSWRYSPSDLMRYYLPVFIKVKNSSQDTLEVASDGVYILAGDRQIKPIPPSEVYVSYSTTFSVSLGYGYYAYPFWWGIGWYPYYEPRRFVYPDVVNKAFRYGSLPPNQWTEGFVYFPHVQSGDNLTLVIQYSIGKERKVLKIPFKLSKKE